MADKKRKDHLDLAWRTVTDSMTQVVLGNKSHSEEFILEATEYIRNIDSSEWYPIAQQILRNNSYIDDHKLAEEAATILVNKAMYTQGLTVRLGGDW